MIRPALSAVPFFLLVACASTPPASHAPAAPPSVVAPVETPPQEEGASAPVETRLSLADVVKQVAPLAKTAVVMGMHTKETAAELAARGMAVRIDDRVLDPSSCMAYPTGDAHDLVVADFDREAPTPCSFAAHAGSERTFVMRMRLAEDKPVDNARVFADARCRGAICDAFAVEASSGKSWFMAGSLPLTPVHSNLTSPAAGKERTATGVLVRTPDGKVAVDLGGTTLGGTTRLVLDGEVTALTRAATKGGGDLRLLDGWIAYEAKGVLAPTAAPVLVRVTGDVRLEGHLGLTTERFPPYKRPAGVPSVFGAISPYGTVGTMHVTRIDGVMDAAALATFDATENAALKGAASKAKSGDIAGAADALRDLHRASKAALGGGPEIGRARFLAACVTAFDRYATDGGADKEERAFAFARSYMAVAHAAPHGNSRSENDLLRAVYLRAANELAWWIDAPDPVAGRRAARALFKMYVGRSESPLPLHFEAARRFHGVDGETNGPI